MVLTPQGHISRYFYGVDFPPKDLRLGLVEASQGKIGNAVDQVLLYCYHYDPADRKIRRGRQQHAEAGRRTAPSCFLAECILILIRRGSQPRRARAGTSQ